MYGALASEIGARLKAFAEIPPSSWFQEVAFCILTPQSSARNASKAIAELDDCGFFEGKLRQGEVAEVLRNPRAYIRFHNTKAGRLLELRGKWPLLERELRAGYDPQRERGILLEVPGLGLKESSHALRNIGRRGLAILDRHILRELVAHGVIDRYPVSLSSRVYLHIEEEFHCFAEQVGVPLDHLDLLFWAKATGEVFK